MKKIILLATTLAILGALTIGVVMAQTEPPETPVSPGNPNGMMGRRGAGGGYLSEHMHSALANLLGISQDEFEIRVTAGESLWNIAVTLGFDANGIADLRNQARLEALELAYADGVLSQEQYQWMRERLNNPPIPGQGGGFGMRGGGQGGGRGQGGGWGMQGDCPNFVKPVTP